MLNYRAIAIAAAVLAVQPAVAQQATPAAEAVVAAGALPAAAVVGDADAPCELHVWPTQNYISMNTGLLVGLGPIGAVVDVAAHADHMKTVKELMVDYLATDAQLAELNKLGISSTLKLQGYRIIVEPPLPSGDAQIADPALKAQAMALDVRIKAKHRLTSSTHKCYAELLATHIFYYKAAMYGSNLFAGWMYREFGDGPTAIKISSGQVKNPLENFPPKSLDNVDEARAELRDAYGKDFAEYVAKKVKPTGSLMK